MAQESTRQVVVVQSTKNVGIAVILAFLFGPLGMFYATTSGALIMMAISLIAAFITLGFGLLLTWPICVIWAGMAASDHNKKLMAG